MSFAGNIGAPTPSRHLFSAGLPQTSSLRLKHPQTRGSGGRGFGFVRHFINPDQSGLWIPNAEKARGPVTGGGSSFLSTPVRHHYSHFFKNVAEFFHHFIQSVVADKQIGEK